MSQRKCFVLLSIFLVTIASCLSEAKGFTLGDIAHHEIPIPVVGPESVAFDCNGAMYAGVADGRVLKHVGGRYGWIEFATTNPSRPRWCDGSTNKHTEHICGRPLGLKFHHETCELYITDPYFGLLKTGPNGGVAQVLATQAEGKPFRFTNDVDINPVTGTVYFTDSSSVYQRRDWNIAKSTGDKTGRLMRYHPNSRTVEVLLDDLSFANGVAVSLDGNFVLVTETTSNIILRYWVLGPRSGSWEVFAHTHGSPDNIKRNIRGEFWVAENIATPTGAVSGTAAKFDVNGHFLEALTGLNPISHAQEYRGNLFIGSIVNPFVGVVTNIH